MYTDVRESAGQKDALTARIISHSAWAYQPAVSLMHMRLMVLRFLAHFSQK